MERLSAKGRPEAALLLGTIPKAHRGIVFIDEINRIADTSPEIADVLLDVMGTKPGRLQIEETGLTSVELSVSVTVWAASNPDEDPGPLENIRRQLSDRFDFAVNVERPLEPSVIRRILEGEEKGPGTLLPDKTDIFMRAKSREGQYRPAAKLKELLAQIYVNFGLESLRGVEAILLGASARGALLGKTPDIDDIMYMARYALRHRSESKNIADIFKFLNDIKEKEKKNFISNDIKKDLPADAQQAAQNKGKEAPDSPKSKDGRFPNPLDKLMARLRQKSGRNDGKASSGSGGIKSKQSIPVAPPNRAVSIKELELKDYIKTEEDFHR